MVVSYFGNRLGPEGPPNLVNSFGETRPNQHELRFLTRNRGGLGCCRHFEKSFRFQKTATRLQHSRSAVAELLDLPKPNWANALGVTLANRAELGLGHTEVAVKPARPLRES